MADWDWDSGDPPRDLYMDIDGMTTPLLFGKDFHISNASGQTLYFKASGSGTGWTFTATELGSVPTGESKYFHVEDFMQRARPSSETTESIVITLYAYTDAGYTTPYSGLPNISRSEGVFFIDSGDASYTEDYHDNFDDGSVMGWAAAEELDIYDLQLIASTDYYLTYPYSLRLRFSTTSVAQCSYIQARANFSKSITTPDKDIIYAIINLRIGPYSDEYAESYSKNVRVLKNSTVLVYLGEEYTAAATNLVVVDDWIRLVIPLPKDTTLTLKISVEDAVHCTKACPGSQYFYTWMDEFKVISK